MARIALIGYGALGRYLLRQLTVLLPQVQFALVVRKLPVQAPANVALLTDAALLQAWQPTLLIECAGHGAVRDHAPAALRAGVDVIVASVGALADGALHHPITHKSLASKLQAAWMSTQGDGSGTGR